MNGFAALDIPPCRRYVVVKATAGFAVCRLILKSLLFYSCLDFTQNLGETHGRPACDVDVPINYCVRNFKSFQLCEDIVCAHTTGQQLFQHVLCFGFLCRFCCFGFSFDLFDFDSGDFLVDSFQRCLLGFQVSFQRIDVRSNRCNFSGNGFLCGLLFSDLCSKTVAFTVLGLFLLPLGRGIRDTSNVF